MTKGLIVVPRKIKFGLWSVVVREEGESLIAYCPTCGEELNPRSIKTCSESQFVFGSDKCIDKYLKEGFHNTEEQ